MPMKRRLLAALAVLVLLPLGLLSWLGFRAAGEEYGALRQSYRTLVQERLAEIDGRIGSLLENHRRALRALVDAAASPGETARALGRDPLLMQGFVQASGGAVLFPAPDRSSSDGERAFLLRTQAIFDRKVLLSLATREISNQFDSGSEFATQESEYRRRAVSRNGETPDEGWYPWFAEGDLQILFWRRLNDGTLVGAEVNRIRLLSDIVGMLPETTVGDALLGSGAVALCDSQGRTLYRWGSIASGAVRFASIALSPPLRAWSLQFELPPGAVVGNFRGGLWLQILAGLSLLSCTLVGAAVFLYREHARDLREAEQRVSFVNQVSHELKTPLTNIRMYAELLEESLPEDDPESRRRLEVVVTESRRLGRLIENVLTFSKRRNGKLETKPRLEAVDERVRATADSFRPALARRNLALVLDLDAGSPIRHDPDVLEQILGNLIGNAEKYASGGGRVIVRSRQQTAEIVVWVRDFGPGIPPGDGERAFQPFVRLSERVDDGVAGTGIGLTIARDLARLHGGDLELVFSNGALADDPGIPERETAAGCCFRARLVVVPA